MTRDRINILIDALLEQAEDYEDEMYRIGYTDALEDLKEVINADVETAMEILRGEIEEDPYPCKVCPYHEQCCQEDWRSCRYDYVAERYIEPQTERSER